MKKRIILACGLLILGLGLGFFIGKISSQSQTPTQVTTKNSSAKLSAQDQRYFTALKKAFIMHYAAEPANAKNYLRLLKKEYQLLNKAKVTTFSKKNDTQIAAVFFEYTAQISLQIDAYQDIIDYDNGSNDFDEEAIRDRKAKIVLSENKLSQIIYQINLAGNLGIDYRALIEPYAKDIENPDVDHAKKLKAPEWIKQLDPNAPAKKITNRLGEELAEGYVQIFDFIPSEYDPFYNAADYAFGKYDRATSDKVFAYEDLTE